VDPGDCIAGIEGRTGGALVGLARFGRAKRKGFAIIQRDATPEEKNLPQIRALGGRHISEIYIYLMDRAGHLGLEAGQGDDGIGQMTQGADEGSRIMGPETPEPKRLGRLAEDAAPGMGSVQQRPDVGRRLPRAAQTSR
jgi:hypothetical protein